MIVIYINGQSIDLYGDETVAITYSALKIGEINSRKGAYSNTFKVPATAKNKDIFGVSNDVHSLSLVPYRQLHCVVEDNGVPIVIGFAVLKSATIHEFELNVFGQNTEWFATLENLSLRDLDLNKYNHVFTANHVRYTRANHHSWQDGYVYPNVEYGRTFNTGGVWMDWRYYRPGVYAKMLFYEILSQAGYQPAGRWWSDDSYWFDETNGVNDVPGSGGADSKWAAFVPFALDRFERNTNYSLRNYGLADTPVFATPAPSKPYLAPYVQFTNIISYPQNGWQFIHPTSGVPVILDSADIQLKLTFSITLSSSANFVFQIYYYDQNGNYTNYTSGTTALTAGTHTLIYTVSLSVSPTELELVPVLSTAPYTAYNNITIELIQYEPIADQPADELLITDAFPFVTLASTLPDISQLDFVKFVCMKYGLVPYHNNYNNQIDFVYIDEVLNNTANPYDWSDKLDLSEQPVITYDLGYQSTLKFKDINDEVDKYIANNDAYNSATIETNVEINKGEQVLYESPFAMLMRQIDSYGGFIRLGYIPLYSPIDTSAPNDPNDDSLFEQLSSEPKFCLIRFEPYHLVQMRDGTITLPLEAPTQPALHGFGITWQKCVERYYKCLEPIVVYPKVVTCLLRLNISDINTLDLSRPVWIEYFKCFFLINEIRQFKAGTTESTEVELVKLGWDLEGGTGIDLKEIKKKYLLLENNSPYLFETNQPIMLEQ